jgi:hypothetical protein
MDDFLKFALCILQFSICNAFIDPLSPFPFPLFSLRFSVGELFQNGRRQEGKHNFMMAGEVEPLPPFEGGSADDVG